MEPLNKPLNLTDYEIAAKEHIPQMFYDYIAGGAGDEVTLRENRSAYDRIKLRPRVLVDVENIDLSTEILGVPLSLPVMLSVTATQKIAHVDGEIASAKAAHSMGTLSIFGTLSNYTIPEIAEHTSGPTWFQLYTYRDMSFNQMMIEEAVSGGAKAIVVTVDTVALGRRERDIRNNFVLGPDYPAGPLKRFPIEQASVAGAGAANVFRSYAHRSRSTSWADLETFRKFSGGLPIILKGIVTAEDAKLAVEHGVDAIIVSNHGGRQLDTCIPTIDALPEVVDAVEGRIPVMVDGGVRRGVDVIKAVAIGARAVLIGRPMMWGLAVGGEAGVRHVLELLKTEIELAMGLCGKRSLADLDRSLLRFY